MRAFFLMRIAMENSRFGQWRTYKRRDKQRTKEKTDTNVGLERNFICLGNLDTTETGQAPIQRLKAFKMWQKEEDGKNQEKSNEEVIQMVMTQRLPININERRQEPDRTGVQRRMIAENSNGGQQAKKKDTRQVSEDAFGLDDEGRCTAS